MKYEVNLLGDNINLKYGIETEKDMELLLIILTRLIKFEESEDK